LSRLLEKSKRGVIVIGSRWVNGGSVSNWPFSRLLISRAGNALGRWALATRTRDVTGGFRIHDRATLERILRMNQKTSGYAFQIEMLKNHIELGSEVIEVPIHFENRTRGQSKMSMAIALEAGVWILIAWVERLRQKKGNY
jgi:dolichol-phosphate mannosyltransferase